MKIQSITAQELLDSRGNPTIEAEVILENGLSARAMVPSGASTGEKEAVELRDGDPARYGGKGVRKAVRNVNEELAPHLVGMEVSDQSSIDWKMVEIDGTPNKARLGANALLGVSMTVARAAAMAANQPPFTSLGNADACLLPVPCMNVINGGRHSTNRVDFQEFRIAPHHAPDFETSIRMGIETFHALKKILADRGYSTGVGDDIFCTNSKLLERAIGEKWPTPSSSSLTRLEP